MNRFLGLFVFCTFLVSFMCGSIIGYGYNQVKMQITIQEQSRKLDKLHTQYQAILPTVHMEAICHRQSEEISILFRQVKQAGLMVEGLKSENACVQQLLEDTSQTLKEITDENSQLQGTNKQLLEENRLLKKELEKVIKELKQLKISSKK